MMDISIRQRDDVTIATLDGRLVAGVGDVELRTTLDRLVADGRRKILLDLSRVQRIDSSGIGELA
ncbi:MAG: STAS domain-containing protein, partial [Acidobacteriota bacterium]